MTAKNYLFPFPKKQEVPFTSKMDKQREETVNPQNPQNTSYLLHVKFTNVFPLPVP